MPGILADLTPDAMKKFFSDRRGEFLENEKQNKIKQQEGFSRNEKIF
ncbi:hypothetical protein [Mesorhizobium sp. B2-8-3]|nr:hypothetical protein [Mesorhizobium sp. B2-8-3]